MILKDYHLHTTFCDGNNTPEEMVLSAIEKGMTDIGFSVHSYMEFTDKYGLKLTDTDRYFDELSYLKEKYADKIRIHIGVEQEYHSNAPTDRFEYIIGSVHFLYDGKKYYPIDSYPECLPVAVNEAFGGDWYLMAEHYYNSVADVVRKTNCDIIGHFDLITKFNETHHYFDATNERYLAAAKKCINKLIPYGKPFEINTGAISRGYRTTPYPAIELISYIKEKGGIFVLSSDAHSAENLMFQFDKWEYLML